eukprot:Rhum_TRINITY_DN13532_c2_g3::Rhum_TRINITY_DN13532_c2_g3_i1::g.61177::m.61177
MSSESDDAIEAHVFALPPAAAQPAAPTAAEQPSSPAHRRRHVATRCVEAHAHMKLSALATRYFRRWMAETHSLSIAPKRGGDRAAATAAGAASSAAVEQLRQLRQERDELLALLAERDDELGRLQAADGESMSREYAASVGTLEALRAAKKANDTSAELAERLAEAHAQVASQADELAQARAQLQAAAAAAPPPQPHADAAENIELLRMAKTAQDVADGMRARLTAAAAEKDALAQELAACRHLLEASAAEVGALRSDAAALRAEAAAETLPSELLGRVWAALSGAAAAGEQPEEALRGVLRVFEEVGQTVEGGFAAAAAAAAGEGASTAAGDGGARLAEVEAELAGAHREAAGALELERQASERHASEVVRLGSQLQLVGQSLEQAVGANESLRSAAEQAAVDSARTEEVCAARLTQAAGLVAELRDEVETLRKEAADAKEEARALSELRQAEAGDSETALLANRLLNQEVLLEHLRSLQAAGFVKTEKAARSGILCKELSARAVLASAAGSLDRKMVLRSAAGLQAELTSAHWAAAKAAKAVAEARSDEEARRSSCHAYEVKYAVLKEKYRRVHQQVLAYKAKCERAEDRLSDLTSMHYVAESYGGGGGRIPSLSPPHSTSPSPSPPPSQPQHQPHPAQPLPLPDCNTKWRIEW